MKPDSDKGDVSYNNYITEMSDDSGSSGTPDHPSQSASTGSDSPPKNHKVSQKKGEERKKFTRSRSRSNERHRSKDRRSRERSRERRHHSRDDYRHGKEGKYRSRKSRSPSYRRRSASPQRKYSRYHGSPSKSNRDRSPHRCNSFERKPTGKLSKFEKLGIPVTLPGTGDTQGLPSYYNPVAMNPAKYAEQVAKRKLLWGSTSKSQDKSNDTGGKPKGNLWQGATFSQDRDGKMTAKFQRLMGIKQPEGETSGGTTNQTCDKDIIKKQEELFSSMEMQYEAARAATHTQRGVGLGFSYHHYPQ